MQVHCVVDSDRHKLIFFVLCCVLYVHLSSIVFFSLVFMLIIPFNVVYVDGQDIATKLSKQITQRTNSIRSSVVKYNAGLAFWNDQFEGLPEALQFDEVKDPESEFYLHVRGASSGDTPLSVKRKVIDLHNFVCRCKEEINYLELEMKRLVLHYESEKTKFEACIDENDEDSSVSITGLKCLLQRRIHECDNKLSTLRSQFSIHLPDEILSDISDKEYKFMSMLECESDKDFEYMILVMNSVLMVMILMMIILTMMFMMMFMTRTMMMMMLMMT